MARHSLRTRPPGGDPRAADGDDEEGADGDGRRIPSVPIPHHTHAHTARSRRAPYSPPRLRNGSFAHASRSGGQRNFLELQALHPAQPPAPVLYGGCTLLYTGRSLDHRNTTGAQRASSARSVSPPVYSSDCLPASPPYACSSPSHANRSTGQRYTTQSSTVFFRALCARMCAIAIALACPHPPRTHAPRPHSQTGPLVSATRIHSEFLRLLYFAADKQASDYFMDLGYEPQKEEFCHRRGVYFHQHRCTHWLGVRSGCCDPWCPPRRAPPCYRASCLATTRCP